MGIVRIYFTSFSDEKYGEVLEEVKRIAGDDRVVEHPSRVVAEFRYIEVRNADKKLAGRLEEALRKHLPQFKIDYVEP